MESFRYLAIDERGEVVRGMIVSHNEKVLDDYLRRIGLTLIRATPVQDSIFTRLFSRGGIKPRILGLFYSRLSQALEVDLPIISILEENAMALASPGLRRVILEVKLMMEEGHSLAKSMEHFPHIFSDLEVSLVAMGEETGTLPQTLKELAEFIEWREDLKSTIKTASIYPAFVLVALGAVVAVWIGYIMPQMANLLVEMGVTLPLMTRIVLFTSKMVQSYWLPTLAVMIGAGAAFYTFLQSPKGRLKFDEWLLQVPLIGKVAENIALTRLTKNFAVMMKGGLPVNKIFAIIARGVLGNRYLEARLLRVQEHLQRGLRMSECFDRAGGFPLLLIGEVRNGESTGTLDQSFERVTSFFDQEAKRSVQGMIAAFGPLIVVILGGIFGIVILSVLMPLYDVIGGVKIY